MKRLHPATMIVAFLPRLAEVARTVLPILFVSFAAGGSDRTEIWIALIGVLGGFGAISTYLTTRFGVQEGQLVCTSGWIFRRDRRIPLEQIQNVNYRQGLLERLFKVATLEVETAAGSGAELKLQVLSETDAEEFRASLLSSAHVSEPVTESAPEAVYQLSAKDLWLGAMTENHGLQVLVFLFSTLGVGALAQVALLNTTWFSAFPRWMVVSVVVGGAFAIMMIGWIFGSISYAFKYAHFSVRKEPGTFRISHGFFTRVQYAVREVRIEYAIITATLWQRWLGRCTVSVGTAGTFGEQGVVAPIGLMVPLSSAQESIERIMPGAAIQNLSWKPLPRYYLVVSLVRLLVTVTVYSLIVLALLQLPRIGSVPLVITGLIALIGLTAVLGLVNGIVGFRVSAYALGDRVFASKQGFFRQSLMLVPLHRVEVVGSGEAPWWRRRGVTALFAKGMVHQVAVPMAWIEDAESLASRILDLAKTRPTSANPL